MIKKLFTNPLVLSDFTPFDPGDDDDTGEGSGQSGQAPFPCSYSVWIELFSVDFNEDGEINMVDYEAWMTDKGWEDQIDPN